MTGKFGSHEIAVQMQKLTKQHSNVFSLLLVISVRKHSPRLAASVRRIASHPHATACHRVPPRAISGHLPSAAGVHEGPHARGEAAGGAARLRAGPPRDLTLLFSAPLICASLA